MAASKLSLFSLALAGLATAQTPLGEVDDHPALTTFRCTKDAGCTEAVNYIVLDSSAHWVHQVDSEAGCGVWGEPPDATACPTKEACAENCVMERQGNYTSSGIATDGANLVLHQLIDGNQVSPRVYLLDESRESYEMMQLTGQEFTFDVDVSELPCGMNSALYLSEMEADGGQSDLNPGGAAWGTGYCDAQCYVTPWINGEVS